MTDLINRVENLKVEELQALYNKYGEPLQEIFKRDDPKLPHFAFILNIGVNYLEENHKEETIDWKAWSIVVLHRLFKIEKLTTKEEIFTHIDQFLEHKKSEYTKYVSNIAIYSDEYFRDCYFIDHYIRDKVS
jgi:hypothetical protein